MITIYNEDGTEYATNATDDNGDINLYAIPEGKYTFVETVAPDGYTLNTSIFEFEVKLDENGKAVITGDTEITDEPTKVIITKTDAYTQKGVPGAVYTFYNVDGAEVGTITTGEDGTGMIEKLPIGTYTYKETVAPKGYTLDPTVYEFTIEADGAINGTTKIEDDPTTVTFTKVNDEGDALEGATFVVYTVEGEEYGTFTTDSTGTFTINYIPVGEYLISEIKAPAGHALNPETYSFTVNPDGSITGVTVIENMMIRVSIQKVDADTGKGLAGAVIEIYDKDGNIVNDITETDADGYITVSKLPAGTYTFKEVKAPEGYEINEEIYTFKINADGSIEGDLIIKDKKIVIPEETPKSTPEKVKTGSAIVVISALAFVSGIVLISLRKKIK